MMLGFKGINLDVKSVEHKVNNLQTSIQALETTFAKLIEGDNNLEMVEELNECKQRYDDLLDRYQALFLKNVQSTKKSTDKLLEADQKVASDIRMLM